MFFLTISQEFGRLGSDYNTQKKTIDQLQTLTSFNKLFEKTIPLRKKFFF